MEEVAKGRGITGGAMRSVDAEGVNDSSIGKETIITMNMEVKAEGR